MQSKTRAPLALATMAALLAQPAATQAAEKTDGAAKSPFRLEVSAGAEHDTNVSISEVDASTAESDNAAVIDADLSYRLALEEDTDLKLSYGLSQSLHDEFSEFDLQNHVLAGDLAHDFGAVDAGGTYRYIHTRLDNDAFLEMYQASPWVSRFFGRKVFVRADYTFTDKVFEDLGERNAEQHAVGADVYYFMNGARTYLLAGYRYKLENANDAQFDYRANAFKLRLSQRLRLAGRDARFKIGWQFEARDYRSVTPSIGKQRDDDRQRLQAELEVPLGRSTFVKLEHEYGDYGSDLPSADYSQHVTSLRFGFRL